jgi:transposase-like protein
LSRYGKTSTVGERDSMALRAIELKESDSELTWVSIAQRFGVNRALLYKVVREYRERHEPTKEGNNNEVERVSGG